MIFDAPSFVVHLSGYETVTLDDQGETLYGNSLIQNHLEVVKENDESELIQFGGFITSDKPEKAAWIKNLILIGFEGEYFDNLNKDYVKAIIKNERVYVLIINQKPVFIENYL